MPILHEVRVDEVIAGLPEIEPLDKDLLSAKGEQILLFAAAGFEDRARALISQHPAKTWSDIILVRYPTNEADNEPTLQMFRGLVIQGERREIVYNRASLWGDLNEVIAKYNSGEGVRAIVDISGMASYVIYPVLEVIRQKLPLATLGVVYVEADVYHPRKQAWDAFRNSIGDLSNPLEIAERYQRSEFESQGPTAVYGSQVFPGSNLDALATQLVAIPSFSLERMKEMLAYSEDQYNVVRDEVQWIFGNPPDRQRNGWRMEAQIELYCAKDDQRSIAISTRHYAEIVRVLDELWETVSIDRHIVIAAVGSKMQHIGIFAFLSMHREVGLVLSEPKEFIAKEFSNGIGPSWWLDFGQVNKMDSILGSRGELRYQW
jgi:hypothetical protein